MASGEEENFFSREKKFSSSPEPPTLFKKSEVFSVLYHCIYPYREHSQVLLVFYPRIYPYREQSLKKSLSRQFICRLLAIRVVWQ